MTRPKWEYRINRIVFALFLILILSLGFMKPAVTTTFAELTPTDLIFPFVFICWLIATVMRFSPFRWHSAFWMFALYFAALLLSSIFSTNPDLSYRKLAGETYLILLAILTANLVTTFKRMKLVLMAWTAGATFPLLIAVLGIVLYYVMPGSSLLPDITYHYGAVPMGNFPRISSTFISASMFCNYLTVTLIVALISVEMRWLRRTPALALVVVISIAAVFTVSIGLGGLFLGAGLWIYFAGRGRTVPRLGLIASSIVAFCFLAIAPIALSVQATSPFTFEIPLLGTFSPSSRMLVWTDAVNTFIASPVTGKGLGTGVAGVVYQNSDGGWSLLTDAHNMFLNVAAQSGIIGLMGLLTIIAAVLKTAFGDREPGREITTVRVGLGIAFVSAFVYEGLTGSFENARHLWVLIGLVIAAANIPDQTDDAAMNLHRA